MEEMKKVYKAKFRQGHGSCKVFAKDEEDAKRVAFATYLYNSMMCNPSPKVDDIIESVELDQEQIMDSYTMQPAVQMDCAQTAVQEEKVD